LHLCSARACEAVNSSRSNNPATIPATMGIIIVLLRPTPLLAQTELVSNWEIAEEVVTAQKTGVG